MFRVDAGFTFPAVGDERAAGGRGVVEAGDVVALGLRRGVRRLEVVAEENRAVVGRVRAASSTGCSCRGWRESARRSGMRWWNWNKCAASMSCVRWPTVGSTSESFARMPFPRKSSGGGWGKWVTLCSRRTLFGKAVRRSVSLFKTLQSPNCCRRPVRRTLARVARQGTSRYKSVRPRLIIHGTDQDCSNRPSSRSAARPGSGGF